MSKSNLLFTDNGADISINRRHRYTLWRIWDKTKPKVLFIGLNPSRADHEYNDPTITRCIRFANSWGYGGLYFGNLYSFRTPDPRELVANMDTAIGPETNMRLEEMIQDSAMVIVAWGSWPFIQDRAAAVLRLIPEPYCLGVNKDRQPKHPLYLKASSQPYPYPHGGNGGRFFT